MIRRLDAGGEIQMSWQLRLPELEDRTVLVTGAASGLGLAIVQGLAEVGASVVLVDRDEKELQIALESLGGTCQGMVLDVVDSDAVSATVEKLESAHPIEVLVNSAGIGGRGPAISYSSTLWDEVMSVNLTGTFNVCRAVGAQMVSRQRGSISISPQSVASLDMQGVLAIRQVRVALCNSLEALLWNGLPRGSESTRSHRHSSIRPLCAGSGKQNPTWLRYLRLGPPWGVLVSAAK